MRLHWTVVLLVAALPCLGGCQFGKLVGGMAANFEYQKQIEVLSEYELSGMKVAVVAHADLAILYEHPDLIPDLVGGVAGRIAREVPDANIVNPRYTYAWQLQTPQWDALPYGEVAAQLDSDLVIYIDVYEYRLNPPGNRWLWEGVCLATINVIEAGGPDPDLFADSYTISSSFPNVKGVGIDAATAQQIQMGLRADFIKRTAWIFHPHLEPKYPDKFRPELETS